MKIFFIFLGFVFLGLSLVGVIVPVLPTFPFLLLTSFFFLKGSDRLNDWFTKTRLYRENIVRWQTHKGLTVKAKLAIIVPVYILMSILFVVTNMFWIRITILVLMAIKTFVFIKMKTISDEDWNATEQLIKSGGID